jgi:hypothetical protein
LQTNVDTQNYCLVVEVALLPFTNRWVLVCWGGVEDVGLHERNCVDKVLSFVSH